MMVKLKYPTKIADQLYPAGTLVPLAPLDEVQAVWPQMRCNPTSTIIAVKFEGRERPTFLMDNQVELCE